MKRKISFLFFLLCFLVLSYFFIIGHTEDNYLLANTNRIYNKIKVFTSILETIQRAYIEEKNTDDLIDDAIKGVLNNLDPHTAFLPADDFQMWNQNFEGYTGIGIRFEILENTITVMSTIESGPAAKQGIQPGDRIVGIDGQHIPMDMSRNEVAQKLMGPVGSSVLVTVESTRWMQPKVFDIVRERIVLKSVQRTFLILPDIGYIKIERFTGKTSAELDQALDFLESQGMKKLILDLRGNSGGYLNAAIEVADKFIPEGKKILTTKGRLSSSYQEFYATAEPTRKMYPLVILIDHGSASASEIVAGSVQDLDRGLIVGERSFGKGLVQSQYRFQDGSALLITTARYYTPSGRGIQREYFDKTKDQYYRDAYQPEPRNNNNNVNSDFHETLTGRPVYGGGGIKPDIIINNRENRLSTNLRNLLFDDQRLFYVFCKKLARKYPQLKNSKENFIRHYRITDKIYKAFLQFIQKSDPKFAQVNFLPDKEDIKFLLKRELAYILWDGDARFMVNLSRDKQLNQAINYFVKARNLLKLARY